MSLILRTHKEEDKNLYFMGGGRGKKKAKDNVFLKKEIKLPQNNTVKY